MTTADCTRLEVTLGPGGPRLRCRGGLFRAVQQLTDGADVTVALIPERALLLAGDQIELDLRVGSGVTLELIEVAGTVAYDMRGATATWSSRIVMEDAASLIYAAQPWVSAAGSSVTRHSAVSLEGSARVVLRETLVLGRHGEDPGQLRSRQSVTHNGVPVLEEALWSEDLTGHRVLDTVAWLGGQPGAHSWPEYDAPAGVTRLQLARSGTLWRSLGGEAHHRDRAMANLVGVGRAHLGSPARMACAGVHSRS